MNNTLEDLASADNIVVITSNNEVLVEDSLSYYTRIYNDVITKAYIDQMINIDTSYKSSLDYINDFKVSFYNK